MSDPTISHTPAAVETVTASWDGSDVVTATFAAVSQDQVTYRFGGDEVNPKYDWYIKVLGIGPPLKMQSATRTTVRAVVERLAAMFAAYEREQSGESL